MALAAVLNLGGSLTTSSLGADTATPAHGGYFHRMAQRLNLTDDQKAQIKTIWQSDKDTLKSLFSQLHAARQYLRATIQAAGANETTVRAASAQVAVVEANLAVERMKIFAKIAPVLTDEQRQQLSELERRADDFVGRAIAHAGGGVAE